MLRFLTRNLLWKFFALVVAIGVWLNVASEPELATIVSVPVDYNNLPKDLEISSDIVESISIEARGPSGQLRNLHDSRVAAIIDFSTVKEPGERTFTLTSADLKLPRQIHLVRGLPDSRKNGPGHGSLVRAAHPFQFPTGDDVKARALACEHS